MTEAVGREREIAGVSVAVFRGGEVLLVRRARPPYAGLWSLPGGKIEPGETPEAAMRRELAEETGISAEFYGVTGTWRVAPPDMPGTTFVLTLFAGRHLAGESRAGGDAAEARWVGCDALAALPLTPEARSAISAARAMLPAVRA